MDQLTFIKAKGIEGQIKELRSFLAVSKDKSYKLGLLLTPIHSDIGNTYKME